MAKYPQADFNEYTRLVETGLSGSKALKQMGIPKGSLGTLKSRFNGADPVPNRHHAVDFDRPTGESQSIGELAQQLNRFTEELLDLTAQLSELTKHAYGLVLLEKTLGQLEIKQMEATGLRRSLEEAERRLISRASVVHSND
jgi:hypothetical protein